MKKESTRNRNKKESPGWAFWIIRILVAVISMAVIVLIISRDKKEPEREEPQTVEVTRLSDEEAAALLEQISLPEEETVASEEIEINEAPEEPEPEAITTEEVVLTDIYAVSGSEVVFKRYHEEALLYQWEYYDFSIKDWVPAEESSISLVMDELFRKVSSYQVRAGTNKQEMVRCKMKYPDGREVIDTASLFILPELISDVSISDYEADVNVYIDVLNIPATITYTSGNKETITGLWGLHFLDITESVEYEESISGNKVEKQLTTIAERNYMLTSKEQQDVLIRYMDGSLFEDSVKVTGIDKIAPVISEVSIGNYEVSNVNKTIPVDVNITAEDNETPYPYLQYAFVHESKKPGNDDFHTSPSFCAEIDKNGVWVAYVKDEYGNYSTQESVIYAVDQKAPKLQLDIQNSEWCKENVIVAIGEDKTELKYRIQCDAQGILGEWRTDSSFTVTENGVYTVSAMDAAGNVTAEEITVENIDNEAPLIIGIKEVGGSYER